MATTVVNKSQAVKDKDGYAGYTFRLEVIMNSYNSSVPSYNVTINHYAKGDDATNHKYHGLTTPKSVIKGVAGSTTYGNVTTTVSQITGSEVKVATWTGDIIANADGNLNITYSASYNANKSSGYLPATHTISETVNMPTIPRYATITSFNVNQRDETSLNVTWGANVTCDYAWYRIRQSGGGYGNWVGGVGTNFNITGLTPNTTYVVQLRVRRQDSQLTTDSGETRNTTYDYPKVTSAPNFIVGNTNTITISNPLHRSCAIYIINPLGTEKGGDTTTDETVSGYVNASWQSFFYNGIPNSTSGLYRVRLVCSEISRDTTVDGGTYSINTNDNKPTFDNFVSQYTANLTTLTNNNQTVINNLSTVTYRITTGATAKNGASISKYVVQWGSISREITDIVNSVSLPKGSGNSLTVTVYDSRNLTTTTSVPFSDYIDYFLPKEIVVNTHRRNGVEETTYGDITGKLYYDTFGTNGEHNALSSITYSVVDGGTDMPYDISTVTYSEQDLTKHEQVFTIKNVIINENTGIQGFDTDKAYTISFKVIDLTGQIVTITGEIKSGKFALTKMCDSNGDYHLGINAIPDEDCALKVNGKIKSESTVNISTELNEDYGVNMTKSKNLCNGVTQGYWINQATNNSGQTTSDSGLIIKVYGGNYTISTTSTQTRYRVGCVISIPDYSTQQQVYNGVNKDGTSDSVTIDTTGYSYLIVNATDLTKIQIEEGSTATNYLPFIPNQIYTDYKESKNLFNKATAHIINGSFSSTDAITTNNNVKSVYIPCKANTTYTISKANATSRFRAGTTTTIPANSVSVSNVVANDSGTTITLTSGSFAKYLIVYYYINGDSTDVVLNTLQIEEGDVATPYEPYITNEPYSECIGITTNPDSRYRVNILKSNNIFNFTIPSATENGITRYMSGSELTLNGTTSGANTIYDNSTNIFRLEAGTYKYITKIISGTFTRTSQDTAIYLRKISDNTNVINTTGSRNFNVESTFTLTEATNFKVIIYANGSGMVFNNLKIGIIITKDLEERDYKPYITPSINVDGEEIYNANIMNYSTEEQVIGKWIDGKTLYRKVYETTTPSATSSTQSVITLSNQNVVKIDGLFILSSTQKLPIMFYDGSNYLFTYQSSSTAISMKTNYNNGLNKTAYITLEYTKTTD